jgi:hypothetical protein
MFNSGDIVQSDKLILIDNKIDNKKNRLCVVLFSLELESGNKVFACPLTKQTKAFNKHSENYFFIPSVIEKFFQFDFAKLDNIVVFDESDLHSTTIKLDELTVNRILEKIKKYEPKTKQIEQYEYIKKIIQYIELFDKLNKQMEKKEQKQKKLTIITK